MIYQWKEKRLIYFIIVRSLKSGVVTILENLGQRSCIMGFFQNVCVMTKTVIKIDSTKMQKMTDVFLRRQHVCNCSTSNISTKRPIYVRMTCFYDETRIMVFSLTFFYTIGVTLTLGSCIFPSILLTNSYYYFTINKYGSNYVCSILGVDSVSLTDFTKIS